MPVSRKDFPKIAEFITDEYSRRKRSRGDLEKIWAEVDRQIAMTPDTTHKKLDNGLIDPNKKWMPETELPLQAQTLEVLCADARRMQLSKVWFGAHSEMTDEYLERAEFEALIVGDEAEVPSAINQDNADKLAQGAQLYWQRQYDFRKHLDLINADAFRYGMGIGRARKVKKSLFRTTAKGVAKENDLIPVLIPTPIKRTYLDDRHSLVMNEGHVLGPAHIFERTIHIRDLKIAAKNGNSDISREDGGWISASLRNLKGDKHGFVKLLEWEGDFFLENLYFPNLIITVVIGEANDKSVSRVLRIRDRKTPNSSYIEFPYHYDSGVYPSSPLMKGMPIQKAAGDALNKLMIISALHALPPLGYDADDIYLAQSGGPVIYPGAQWKTLGDIKEYKIGDPSVALNVYLGLLSQYADVTGVNAPRLGAQTVSHTTAFAKEAELSRGTVRTVDYVEQSLQGPLTKFLDLAYQMGREDFKQTNVFIEEYGGFVRLSKDVLPEKVIFEAFGAGGPAEEQAKTQNKLQALQLALSLDQLLAQQQANGLQGNVNIEAAQEQVLREGGWTDVDFILRANSPTEGAIARPQMEGNLGGDQIPAGEALQAFSDIG